MLPTVGQKRREIDRIQPGNLSKYKSAVVIGRSSDYSLENGIYLATIVRECGTCV